MSSSWSRFGDPISLQPTMVVIINKATSAVRLLMAFRCRRPVLRSEPLRVPSAQRHRGLYDFSALKQDLDGRAGLRHGQNSCPTVVGHAGP
jgi:hypothetical protein